MRKSLLFLLPLVPLTAVYADVTLPPLISDNMLLQSSKATVWGKADPGEAVTVKLGATVLKTTAGQDGNWRVMLEGLKPGIAGDMTVSGKNNLTVKNVAVGDVWVCSGQSNMEMTVVRSGNFEQEIAAANFPQIRMFTVPKTASETPLEEVVGKWEVCEPANVPHWSAVGYFFGRKLHQDLAIPVGLLHTSWGGTSAQAWTPTEVLQGDPDFKTAYYDTRQAQLAHYPRRNMITRRFPHGRQPQMQPRRKANPRPGNRIRRWARAWAVPPARCITECSLGRQNIPSRAPFGIRANPTLGMQSVITGSFPR